eukprot:363973-Chlamydomonas_euryale.AAC.6
MCEHLAVRGLQAQVRDKGVGIEGRTFKPAAATGMFAQLSRPIHRPRCALRNLRLLATRMPCLPNAPLTAQLRPNNMRAAIRLSFETSHFNRGLRWKLPPNLQVFDIPDQTLQLAANLSAQVPPPLASLAGCTHLSSPWPNLTEKSPRPDPAI